MRPTALGLLRTAYVLVAALLTAVILPRLGVPAVWMPDLVLLGVVATAVLRGPTHGGLAGLLAGWVVELIPPGGRPLGLMALTFMLAGGAAGMLRTSSLQPMVRTTLALVVAGGVVLAGRVASVVVAEGSLDAADGLTRLAATCAAAALVIPPMTAVDRALVRRRLG